MRFWILPVMAILLMIDPAAALEVLQISREITTKGQAPVLRLYPGTGLNISFLETDETVYKIWFDDPSWASLDVEGSLEEDDLKGAKIIHLKRTHDLVYEHNITSQRTTLTLVTDRDIHRFVVEKADAGVAVYDTISIVQGQPIPVVTAEHPGLPVPDSPIPFPPAVPGDAIQGTLPAPPPVAESPRSLEVIAPQEPITEQVVAPEHSVEAQAAVPSLEQELDRLKEQLQARRQQEKQARKDRRQQERQAKREQARKDRLERRRAKQRAKIEQLQAQIKALQGHGDPEESPVQLQPPPQAVQRVAIEVPQPNTAWQADADPTERSPLELAHLLSKGANIARTLPRPEIEFSRRRHSNWVKVQRIIRRLRRGVAFDEAVAAERINAKYVRDLLAYGLQSERVMGDQS